MDISSVFIIVGLSLTGLGAGFTALGQHRIYNKKEKGAASPKAEYA